MLCTFSVRREACSKVGRPGAEHDALLLRECAVGVAATIIHIVSDERSKRVEEPSQRPSMRVAAM